MTIRIKVAEAKLATWNENIECLVVYGAILCYIQSKPLLHTEQGPSSCGQSAASMVPKPLDDPCSNPSGNENAN